MDNICAMTFFVCVQQICKVKDGSNICFCRCRRHDLKKKNIALTLVKIPGNIGTYMLVTFHMKYYNTIKLNTKWIKFLRCRLWFVYDIKINYKTDWYVQIKRLMYFLRNKNKIPFWLIYSNIIHLIQSIMPTFPRNLNDFCYLYECIYKKYFLKQQGRCYDVYSCTFPIKSFS